MKTQQKRQLTEPEAWREIARRIAENQWSHFGLCKEMDRLCFDDFLTSDAVWNAMYTRSRDHRYAMSTLAGVEPGYVEDPGVASTRVLMALFLALEAEDEAAA